MESHIRYGNLLWGYLSAVKLHNLLKLQERTIKDSLSSAPLSVNELIKPDQAMMVHKVLNEQCREILKQKLTKRPKDLKYESE